MKVRTILILMALVFVPLVHTRGQTISPNGSLDILASGIFISTTPEFPGPGETVTARLNSSTVDLDVSNIAWSLNGVRLQSDKGLRLVTFTAGEIGSRTVISVDITANEGKFSRSITINVGSVDLLWQGGGYVPPFYKGRTLWGHQTLLKVVAMPNIPGNPSSFIYRWSIDGGVVGASSGTGRNSFAILDSLLGRPKTIKVDVMTDRDTIVATGSIFLNSRTPQVLVYEKSPLYGIIFEREVGETFTTTNKEFSFTGIPLFFTAATRNSSELSYEWRTGAIDLKTGSDITYRAPEETGTSQINLKVDHLQNVTQSAEKKFIVQFNNQTSL